MKKFLEPLDLIYSWLSSIIKIINNDYPSSEVILKVIEYYQQSICLYNEKDFVNNSEFIKEINCYIQNVINHVNLVRNFDYNKIKQVSSDNIKTARLMEDSFEENMPIPQQLLTFFFNLNLFYFQINNETRNITNIKIQITNIAIK